MKWRRRLEGGNPAWPGLVDIFIFTMVLILIGYAQTKPTGTTADLKAEIARLNQQLSKMESEKKLLEDKIDGLKDQLASGLTNTARKKLAGLSDELAKKIDNNDFNIKFNPEDLEIAVNAASEEITFDKGKYDLKENDISRLANFAKSLQVNVTKEFVVVINGEADPRILRSMVPPRNNTELSALRAATVMAIVEGAAPGLGQNLQVVGLGSKRQDIVVPPNATEEEKDWLYKPCRTVKFRIRVNLSELIPEATRMPE
jgi:flagellar motor protein MotB